MEREDIKLIPLATVGLMVGLVEVFARPFIKEQAQRVGKVAMASITYYHTPDGEKRL